MLLANTIILGNGFDLDLGLKTSYRDFLKSNQFRTLLDENCGMDIDMNIFQFIKDQSQLETWGGVEASLLDFVQKFKTCPNQKIKNTIRSSYEKLEKGIADYLADISYEAINESSCAIYLLHRLSNMVNVYSYNYTDVNRIPTINNSSVKHLHGTLKENNIILGVQDANITNGLGFVKKSYHSNYNSMEFVRDRLASERILFFGHSLCMSDKEYFTSLFCASQNNHCKQIDFIIHDENGKDLILDNIEQLSKLNIAKVRENIRINFHFTKEQYKGETKKAIDDFMDDSDNKYSFCFPDGRYV